MGVFPTARFKPMTIELHNDFICVQHGAEENIWTKSKEVEGGWRRLQNEELHNLYASSNIVSVIKSKRMRWVGYVTRTGGM
jgi:hypothetical protein